MNARPTFRLALFLVIFAAPAYAAGAPTAEDQSQDSGDVRITQEIRRAVMADDSLSFGAKNAAIITSEGRVTLRGRVEEREKEAIERHAERAAPGAVETNLLETKA